MSHRSHTGLAFPSRSRPVTVCVEDEPSMNLLTFIRLVRPRAYHLLSRQHLPFTSTRKHDAKRQDFRISLPESFPNFGVQLKMCKTLRCMRDCIHRRRPSTPSLLDWWMPEPYKSPKIRNLTCISRFPS